MKTLVEIKHLCLGYDGQEVIHDLNMTIDANDYIVLLGPNGSGKSTLVKGLLKLIRPMNGEVIYHLEHNMIGYMPQITKVDAHFPGTVFEIVQSGALNRLGHRPFFSSKEKNLALESMRMLKIEDLKNHPFANLSGGQKQKVLLARALCATRELLILDEPSNNLDLASKAEFYQLINELHKQRGIAIMLITHDEYGKDDLGNKVMIFNDHSITIKKRGEQ